MKQITLNLMKEHERESEIDIVGFFGRLVSKIVITFCLGEECASKTFAYQSSIKGTSNVPFDEFMANLLQEIASRNESTYNQVMGGVSKYSFFPSD
jgi:hypothetical protein